MCAEGTAATIATRHFPIEKMLGCVHRGVFLLIVFVDLRLFHCLNCIHKAKLVIFIRFRAQHQPNQMIFDDFFVTLRAV